MCTKVAPVIKPTFSQLVSETVDVFTLEYYPGNLEAAHKYACEMYEISSMCGGTKADVRVYRAVCLILVRKLGK